MNMKIFQGKVQVLIFLPINLFLPKHPLGTVPK